MKISYITMQFPIPSETFAANDVKNLIDQGIDVNIFSLRKQIKNHDYLIKERGLEGVEINSSSIMDIMHGIVISATSIHKFLRVLFFIIKCVDIKKIGETIKSIVLLPRIFSIYNRLLKNKPDVVHLFWGHYPSLLGYLINKFNPDIKLTVFLGAYDLEMNYKPSYYVARNADKVFTHANINIPLLKDMGVSEDKICVSYRGVNISNFIVDDSKKINGKIVTAGRLIETKGFEEVIIFFSKIVAEKPYLKLNILGDGPQKSYLENLAKSLGLEKSITFLGHVSHEEVFNEMNESEFFLLFSKKSSERLPNVVKEAMYTNNVCFVTETPGIYELIEDGMTGFVRKVENINEFIGLFLNLVDNNSQKKIAEKAHNHIIENFSINVSMKKYITEWEEIISN